MRRWGGELQIGVIVLVIMSTSNARTFIRVSEGWRELQLGPSLTPMDISNKMTTDTPIEPHNYTPTDTPTGMPTVSAKLVMNHIITDTFHARETNNPSDPETSSQTIPTTITAVDTTPDLV